MIKIGPRGLIILIAAFLSASSLNGSASAQNLMSSQNPLTVRVLRFKWYEDQYSMCWCESAHGADIDRFGSFHVCRHQAEEPSVHFAHGQTTQKPLFVYQATIQNNSQLIIRSIDWIYIFV